MKPSEQRLSEACRQQHRGDRRPGTCTNYFKRLPMLSGFWLRPDLKVAELSVFTWPAISPSRSHRTSFSSA